MENNLQNELHDLLEKLRELKTKYKSTINLDYVFRAVMLDKNSDEALVAEAFNLDDPNRIYDYIISLQKQHRFTIEIGRFDMLRRFKVCRVVCIEDKLPPSLKPKDVPISKWIRKSETYRLVGMSADNSNYVVSLHLETMDGESITPPLPYDGFDSRRFVLDDYTKLN